MAQSYGRTEGQVITLHQSIHLGDPMMMVIEFSKHKALLMFSLYYPNQRWAAPTPERLFPDMLCNLCSDKKSNK
jgi:hypothetical protein